MADADADENQNQFDAVADDLAKFFKISPAAVYRLAREQRLPVGSFTYLNARTVRFNLGFIKRWAYEGGGITPPVKKAA